MKAKGEEDAAGNRIGKWYLYSETGRLSVEENGVVRKPTKEEKASHESYLQESFTRNRILKTAINQGLTIKEYNF